jgi:hypothetical protein
LYFRLEADTISMLSATRIPQRQNFIMSVALTEAHGYLADTPGELYVLWINQKFHGQTNSMD